MNTSAFTCIYMQFLSICIYSVICIFLWRFRWTRREQADFYRTVSSFGVVYDPERKAFDWSQFRALARLERKTDESLERYFNSFVNMCRTACKLPPRKEEGTVYDKCRLGLFLTSVMDLVYQQGNPC